MPTGGRRGGGRPNVFECAMIEIPKSTTAKIVFPWHPQTSKFKADDYFINYTLLSKIIEQREIHQLLS